MLIAMKKRLNSKCSFQLSSLITPPQEQGNDVANKSIPVIYAVKMISKIREAYRP